MKEKPRILVMYGYHRREKFAIDVGSYLQHQSLDENVVVKKYSCKPDHPAWNPRYGRPARFPNRWRFVREQGKTDYVVDIHSGDGRADPDWRAAGLIQADTYDSFDPVFRERINKFAESSPFPTFRTVHYVPRNHLMPKGIVDIELEFLPPNISLRRARQYTIGLIRALC